MNFCACLEQSFVSASTHFSVYFQASGTPASAFISAFALLQAARSGLPKIVLARMSLNILINELVGIIPGIGDAFSFWFKSNARNYRILQEHATGTRKTQRSDWIFVIAVLVLLFLSSPRELPSAFSSCTSS